MTQNSVILLDGAMGTMLQNMGYDYSNQIFEEINIDNSDVICDIHKKYVKAGSSIITTNTFGANRIRLKNSKYTLENIIKMAVENAKCSAKNSNVHVALDIGPIGEFMEPLGPLSFTKAYDVFKEVVLLGEKYGADLYIIETMTDLNEAKAALMAVKENSNKKVYCTMSFGKDGNTFMGDSPESVCKVLESLGADAVGVNCSFGPEQLLPVVKRILSVATGKVIAQPNAGIPYKVNGRYIYNIDKEKFADYMMKYVDLGVSLIGGCCGTTDKYISLINTKIRNNVY